jgi:hypothetical protein
MMVRERLRTSIFDVSVVGRLGPVLENALQPCIASGTHLVTIVRARVADGVDIPELLARLDALHLDVVDIALVEQRVDRGANHGVVPRRSLDASPWSHLSV